MIEKLTIKYFSNNESAKVAYQAWEDATGYDFFAAEAKTLLPISFSFKQIEIQK